MHYKNSFTIIIIIYQPRFRMKFPCVFDFFTVYSPDMPKRLPVMDIVRGLAKSMGTAVKCWLHYTLVTFAWLGVVPVTACK